MSLSMRKHLQGDALKTGVKELRYGVQATVPGQVCCISLDLRVHCR